MEAGKIFQNNLKVQVRTVIMRALFEGDKYGYEIRKIIEARTAGQYRVKQPTLYNILNRLEQQGFVQSYDGDESVTHGGKRRYYKLTELGIKTFTREQSDWEYSRTIIDNLISDKEVDLGSLPPPEKRNRRARGDAPERPVHTRTDADAENVTDARSEYDADANAEAAMTDTDTDTDKTRADEFFAETENAAERPAANAFDGDATSSVVIDGFDADDAPAAQTGTSFAESFGAAQTNPPVGEDDDDNAPPPPTRDRAAEFKSYSDTVREQRFEATSRFTRDSSAESDGARGGEEQNESVASEEKDDRTVRDTIFANANYRGGENEDADDAEPDEKEFYETANETRAEGGRDAVDLGPPPDDGESRYGSFNSKKPRVLTREEYIENYVAVEYKNILDKFIKPFQGREEYDASFRADAATDYAEAAYAAAPPQPAAEVVQRETGVKIRRHDRVEGKNVYSKNHIYVNRMRLFKNMALFAALELIVIMGYLILTYVAAPDFSDETAYFYVGMAIPVIPPIYALISYSVNPDRKKRFDSSSAETILRGAVLSAVTGISVYILCFAFGMSSVKVENFAVRLVVFIGLATGFFIDAVLLNRFRKGRRFSVAAGDL